MDYDQLKAANGKLGNDWAISLAKITELETEGKWREAILNNQRGKINCLVAALREYRREDECSCTHPELDEGVCRWCTSGALLSELEKS